MQIRAASGYGAYALMNSPSRPAATPETPTGTSTAATTDTVTISSTARERLATQTQSASISPAKAVYNTDQGDVALDIDDYFTPQGIQGASLARSLPPLLLPTQGNIDTLAEHISSLLPGLQKEYGIPTAPKNISYDSQGEIQLPEDYPYADEFTRMLKDNPTLERQLSTVNALASHAAGIKASQAFQKEYAAASSQADADAIVDKYSYLFSDERPADTISLGFSASGTLTVKVNGEPLA